MAAFGKIEEFNPDSEDWNEYTERLNHYFIANDIGNVQKKRAILLSVIGSKSYKLLRNLSVPSKPGDLSYDALVKLMKSHISPQPTVMVERRRFNMRDRHTNESISTYVAELRRLASTCDYTDIETQLRDRLVCGINNDTMQKRLLTEKNLVYNKAYALCLGMETAAKEVQAIKDETHNSKSVNKTSIQHEGRRPVSKCDRCGDIYHTGAQCFHRNSDCHNCGKRGHISRVCHSAPNYSSQRGRGHRGNRRGRGRGHHGQRGHPGNRGYSGRGRGNHAHHIEENLDEEVEYELYRTENSSQKKPSLRVEPYMIDVIVNGKKVTLELDTGAATTVISEVTYTSVFKDGERPVLREAKEILRGYMRERIPILGTAEVEVCYGQQTANLPLTIVQGDRENLLGRDWLQVLKIDWGRILHVRNESLNDIIRAHEEVFREDLGELKEQTVQIQITSDTPRFYKHRNVAYALREKVEDELDKLEKQGVIKPVQFSKWAAPIVPVVKNNGQVRICGDYKLTVNRVAQVDVYPIPRIEDLFASLSGGQSFTKLDLSQAYQQLTLDEESKELTTINTHRGLYQYQRLPFGISAAPAIFQRTIECLLKGIPHVCVYLDDILVTGDTEDEHLDNIRAVLDRLKNAGLRLNGPKCKFLAKSVEYLGHRIDKEGLHPLNEKVEAVVPAPAPRNVSELKSFLGLVQYYQRFLPNLSTTLGPLHHLLRKEVTWRWEDREETAFNKVKDHLSSCKLLTHYDPKKQLLLACDASPYGIGAVLSHILKDGTERPVAFASRSLSDAEKNYSQLDREALAIIFGTKKFHQYIYGRTFTLVSDHKPLESIFSPDKAISPMASSRIQRWALTLSAYSYTIEYRKGSILANADCMSRLPLSTSVRDPPLPGDTILLLESLEASPVKTQQIKQWTDRDSTLSRVRTLLLSGWSDDITLGEEFRPYEKRRDELSVQSGCILWGNRIVVPTKGRQRVMDTLHEAHPGITRMKSVARGMVWWPNMDLHLEEKVKTCEICQQTRPVPPESTLHPWEWPEKPWSRLHLDYAGPFLGKMFLVCIDAHSKWLEVFPLNSSTSSVTIECLRRMFATHGLPETVVTDNGTCFTSEEFTVFMKKNGIQHVCVAPYHPASNGLAERAVQTFKNGVKRMTEGSIETRVSRFLFKYRVTPQATTGVSPAELLLGRRPRTHLDLLHPDVSRRVQQKQEKQKITHDARAKYRDIRVGDLVYVLNFRPGEKWLPGIAVEQTGPVSYKVRLTDGVVVRRHLDHVRLRCEIEENVKTETVAVKSANVPNVTEVITPLVSNQSQSVMLGDNSVCRPETSVSQAISDVTPRVPTSKVPKSTSPGLSVSEGLRRSSRVTRAPDRLNLKTDLED